MLAATPYCQASMFWRVKKSPPRLRVCCILAMANLIFMRMASLPPTTLLATHSAPPSSSQLGRWSPDLYRKANPWVVSWTITAAK